MVVGRSVGAAVCQAVSPQGRGFDAGFKCATIHSNQAVAAWHGAIGLAGILTAVYEGPLQTLRKFCALQVVNGEHAKHTLLALRGALSSPSGQAATIGWGLQWLEQVDLREDYALAHRSVDLLYGEEDQVLSVKTAQDTMRIWQHARVERIAQAGHAPFVSHPQRFLRWVSQSSNHE